MTAPHASSASPAGSPATAQNVTAMPRRTLGCSGIEVSVVALGCWPISGMTSLDVNEPDSLATLEACLDTGVNFLDTAYCYGRCGESERLIARALGAHRQRLVIATKGGLHWDDQGRQVRDARPETLRRQCDESLARLNTDHVDLLYLHAPDPTVPIAESAGALGELLQAGKTRSVGASNFTLAQLEAFHRVCPLAAYQPAYNLLMREIEADVLPWCRAHHVAVVVYWPLMKGLLSGKLPRDFVFRPGDGRAKYPMFQGDEWQRNQDLLDRLRTIATRAGKTLGQLAIAWALQQPGITAALCGAKRPDQLRENAAAVPPWLSAEELAAIDAALAERGTPVSQNAVR